MRCSVAWTMMAVSVGGEMAALRLGGWVETQVVQASTNASAFGMSVGVTRDRVVIGGQGAAWKFVREFGEWTASRNSFYPAAAGETARVATDEDLTLVATSSRTATYRRDEVKASGLPGGIAVAVSGDAALIATEEAVVAVFLLDNVWTQRGVVARYRRPAVAVSTMAVIGGEGEVHSYVRFGTSWIERDIVRQEGAEGFGSSIALDGATMVVGATNSAFVYEKSFDDAGWSLVKRLAKSGGFGASVAVASNGVVVVGAPDESTVYSWHASEPDDLSPVVASVHHDQSRFGISVDLALDDTEALTLVVGAPGLDAAFIFVAAADDDDLSQRATDDKVRVVHRPDALAYVLYYLAPLLVITLAILLCLRYRKPEPRAKPEIVSAEVRLVQSGDDAVPVVVLETTHDDPAAPHATTPPSPTSLFLRSTVAVACLDRVVRSDPPAAQHQTLPSPDDQASP